MQFLQHCVLRAFFFICSFSLSGFISLYISLSPLTFLFHSLSHIPPLPFYFFFCLSILYHIISFSYLNVIFFVIFSPFFLSFFIPLSILLHLLFFYPFSLPLSLISLPSFHCLSLLLSTSHPREHNSVREKKVFAFLHT